LIDIEYINNLIENNQIKDLAEYMKIHNLVLTEDNKIIKKQGSFSDEFAFWDKRQLVKKILLNS
jgi:hypothetical protein